ncbi:MAG: biopolymer transporter ExbD [bacterium]|nr:biopolymer transporter ExbD [bacterium]
MKIFESHKKRTNINITALVDILFLLIIFFAVSTQFTNQRSIGVDLPRSTTGTTVSILRKLMIVMKDEDVVLINGIPVDWPRVMETIKEGDFDKTQKVILNIDKKIAHGKVIQLLDILKLQQFTKVVFGTYASS